jgi:hypothetical protein
MKERDKCLNDVDVFRQQVAETLKSLRDDEQELKELLERHENEHGTEEEGLNDERQQPEKALALTIAKVRAGYNKPTTEPPDNDPKVQLLDSHSDVKDYINFGSADSFDVDAMLASFLEAEEKKFSILNHISELTLEKEQTEKDILRLSRDIETLTRTNFHQYNFSPGASHNIRQTKTKSCDAQEKSRVVECELSSLKAAIKDVYGQLNCESFIPGSQLVLGEAVTDSNVMQFLAIIEQVSSALLVVIRKSSVFEVVPMRHILFYLKYFLQCAADIVEQYNKSKGYTSGDSFNFFTPAPASRSIPFQIDPPGVESEVLDGFCIDDDDGRPLSTKEIQMKIRL